MSSVKRRTGILGALKQYTVANAPTYAQSTALSLQSLQILAKAFEMFVVSRARSPVSDCDSVQPASKSNPRSAPDS